MDEQVRSGHDVPAAGDPAAGHAPPDHPNGKRHHLAAIRRMPITVAETGNFASSPPTAASTTAKKAIAATYYGI